jgi:hypothetical protein
MLVLVANFGAAPVQSGFAEFFLAPTPPMVQIRPDPVFAYERRAMPQQASWTSLGVSTFSLASSVASIGEVGWALSPRKTAVDLGTCAVVRVFEPIQDGLSSNAKSWEERKLAFCAFNPNFSGSWSGTEKNASTGAALGTVDLTIIQNWDIVSMGPVQAHTPVCKLNVVKLPSLPAAPIQGIQASMYGSLYYTINTQGGDALHMIFTFRRDGSMNMELTKGAVKSITRLTLQNRGNPPPEPSKSLLKKVRKIIPSYWPPERKSDARHVYDAFSKLGV